jgi:hypothetical protein
LKDLSHQNKVEGVYSLLEQDGTPGEGEISLKMHLIWSDKTYYETSIKFCDDHLKNIREQSKKLNDLLFSIENKPFGILFVDEIKDILETKMFIKDYDISNLSKKPRLIFQNDKRSFMTNIGNIFRGGLGISRNYEYVGLKLEWSSLTKQLMWAILILSGLSMIDRSDFVNVSIRLIIPR